VADPKDGFSRGVEGCTEAEEVEVGRIDRMDVLALAAAALPMLWSLVRKVHAYTRALLKVADVDALNPSFGPDRDAKKAR
jgi:hypothetical protein